MNGMAERLQSLAIGIVMILLGVTMVISPDDGYDAVIFVYGAAMTFAGLRMLWFFFRLARYMVGGRIMLYLGSIYLDFGVYTLTLQDVPRFYILLYLSACHLFAGLVDILRALEAKKLGAGAWKLNASFALGNIGMAVLCLIFIRRTEAVVYIFSAGLLYSALVRIYSAFRRTAVIYIR